MEALEEFEYDGNTEMYNLPDPTADMAELDPETPGCGERSPAGFLCSLAAGHEDAQHVAFTVAFIDIPAKVVAVWTAQSE